MRTNSYQRVPLHVGDLVVYNRPALRAFGVRVAPEKTGFGLIVEINDEVAYVSWSSCPRRCHKPSPINMRWLEHPT